MAPENEPEPTPANQSPDTETDDGPVIDLDELADRMWAKAPEHLKAKDSPTQQTEGDSAGAGEPAAEAVRDEPAPARTPEPSGGVVSDVEGLVKRTVDAVLGDRDHQAQHEALTRPPEPKPARRGLAAAVWGKDRK